MIFVGFLFAPLIPSLIDEHRSYVRDFPGHTVPFGSQLAKL